MQSGMAPMRNIKTVLRVMALLLYVFQGAAGRTAAAETVPAMQPSVASARLTGHLADTQLAECSGIDISLATKRFLWAINDSGSGPVLHAVGFDGKNLGRVRVARAQNRDWEDIATFLWQGSPMILVADIGNNAQRHGTHTLYIVREPASGPDGFAPSATVPIAWRIDFSYPDRGHDAEAVAVDPASGQILILTKRDARPLLFALPLAPSAREGPLVARQHTDVDRIPPPTAADLLQVYGRYRSQPTAMDVSADGSRAVVLTYKHAYRFVRQPGDTWQTAFRRPPQLIRMPLPEERIDFGQREAICFAPDGTSFYVTSEGPGAAIFRVPAE